MGVSGCSMVSRVPAEVDVVGSSPASKGLSLLQIDRPNVGDHDLAKFD